MLSTKNAYSVVRQRVHGELSLSIKISEQEVKSELVWTDAEVETSTSDKQRKQGNREHVLYVPCTVYSMYSVQYM